MDYRSSGTDGTINGLIVGAEIHAWIDNEMKLVRMKDYDCIFAVLSDEKQQCVAGCANSAGISATCHAPPACLQG